MPTPWRYITAGGAAERSRRGIAEAERDGSLFTLGSRGQVEAAAIRALADVALRGGEVDGRWRRRRGVRCTDRVGSIRAMADCELRAGRARRTGGCRRVRLPRAAVRAQLARARADARGGEGIIRRGAGAARSVAAGAAPIGAARRVGVRVIAMRCMMVVPPGLEVHAAMIRWHLDDRPCFFAALLRRYRQCCRG